jgi:hypothetical protein
MLVFTDHGTTARVSFGDARIILDDDQVTQVWCQIARLYDNFHIGDATIYIADRPTRLVEHQWKSLYDDTSNFINKFFWAAMLEENTLH